MIKSTRGIRRIAGLTGLASILLLNPGCENNDYSSPSSPTIEDNYGMGLEHFTLDIAEGHMFNGQRTEVTGSVIPGANYRVNLFCSNDGDKDVITVLASGQEVIKYVTQENRMGGNGWYVEQKSPAGHFTSSSSEVTFEIITQTDEWGTWPQAIDVNIEK